MNEYFGLTFNDHVILYAINITDWSGVDEEILSFFRARKTPVIHTNLLLNDILSNSYGLLIFQEQLMEIAQRIGGLSLEDSDDLRRYMAKKHLNGMTKYKPTFVQNAINNGYTEQQANELFKWLGDVLPYSLNNELQRELLSNG
ncbi:MAG: hypothetical protein EGS50_07690 [Alistipes senegalensis]|nr:hypothetical protein [Alistipes senegalensis]